MSIINTASTIDTIHHHLILQSFAITTIIIYMKSITISYHSYIIIPKYNHHRQEDESWLSGGAARGHNQALFAATCHLLL